MNIVSVTDGKQQNTRTEHKMLNLNVSLSSLLARGATDQCNVTGHGTEFHFPKQMLPVVISCCHIIDIMAPFIMSVVLLRQLQQSLALENI